MKLKLRNVLGVLSLISIIIFIIISVIKKNYIIPTIIILLIGAINIYYYKYKSGLTYEKSFTMSIDQQKKLDELL